AVQLDLTGVSAAEILDAQRAIETLGAELAAEKATTADIARLRQLLAEAAAQINDLDAFTRLSRDFHLAVAEASHNRVLVVQLISLEHVSWPHRNAGARAAHSRSPHQARRSHRMARRARRPRVDGRPCAHDPRPARRRARSRTCRRTLLLTNNTTTPGGPHEQVHHRTALPPAGMDRPRQRLFHRGRPGLRVPRAGPLLGRQ